MAQRYPHSGTDRVRVILTRPYAIVAAGKVEQYAIGGSGADAEFNTATHFLGSGKCAAEARHIIGTFEVPDGFQTDTWLDGRAVFELIPARDLRPDLELAK